MNTPVRPDVSDVASAKTEELREERHMKIAIGADHRGYALKELIKEIITDIDLKPIEWIDVGAFSSERSDYPEFAIKVAHELQKKYADLGVLLCGSAVGMAMTANRFPGIYAAVAWNEESARVGRADDNSNVLVIPTDFVSDEEALNILRAWLRTEFKNGRYAERLKMIEGIEELKISPFKRKS